MNDPQILLQNIANSLTAMNDWEDRYNFIMELGQALPKLSLAEKSIGNKVHGCVSQVWLVGEARQENGETRISFRGESDSMIVQGLIAILLAIYSERTAQDIAKIDALGIFDALGLREHLTAQRSNGLVAVVRRIQSESKVLSQ